MGESGTKNYRKDALFYIESDEESDEVYVVESGEVALSGTPGIPRFRSVLGPGDIFGFTSCLCRRPRMETAKARTDCTCAVLERDRFLESVQSNPDLAGRIISYFAQELRVYDDQMASPSEESSAADDEAYLYAQARHFADKGQAAHAHHVLAVYLARFPKGMHATDASRMLAALNAKGTKPAIARQKGLCRAFADRQMIFCEHEQGDELFVIKSGKVEILKIAPPEEILLSVLREGDIFGELSIVSSDPRSAAAISAGETLLLPVSRASLSSVFQRSPATIGKILVTLSQRLWFTFIRLRARVYENPVTRAYVLLENKLLADRISLAGTKPCTLPLGIGEILSMAGVPAGQVNSVKDQLTDDPNLSFQFRQITIESPSALEARARYFRTRDHLDSPELKLTPRRRSGAISSIGLDPREMRVPTETIPDS
jgi:CRP/FNR family transcriptional regulator